MRSSAGSIMPHGKGSWRVQVEHGRDPVTGKRLRYSRVVHGSRKKAEQVRLEMLTMANDPRTEKGAITLGDFWEHCYLPDAEERLRPVTVHGYVSHYRTFIKGSGLDGIALGELKPMEIKRWLRGIEGDKRKHEAFKILRQICNKAIRWDVLKENPCDHVERPSKPNDYEPEVLTAEEVAAYVQTFRGTQLEALVLLCLGCGLRRSEAVALDWEDVKDGEIDVTHAVTSVGGKAWDDDPKSRFGERTVAVPAAFNARLEELRGTGPIVKDTEGNRMNPDNVSKLYGKIQRRLPEGVKAIPLMNLRHTSLSLFYEATGDLLATSRRGGHSSMSITSRYYVRPSRAVDRAGADALDKLLGSNEKTS